MNKKLIAVLLSLTMVFTNLSPIMASAAELPSSETAVTAAAPVNSDGSTTYFYPLAAGNPSKRDTIETLEAGSFTVVDVTKYNGQDIFFETPGWYLFTGTATLTSIRARSEGGNYNFILADGCDITVNATEANAAVDVRDDAVANRFYLTIWAQSNGSSTGKLTANGGPEGGAGIGHSGSGLTINGGIITATGGTDTSAQNLFDYAGGAGIGGSKNSGCQNLTINGGTIVATGGVNAAGIGSGANTYANSITINGGDITAYGSLLGAGIGGGSYYDTDVNKMTNVYITGGLVRAAGMLGFAIGGGGYYHLNQNYTYNQNHCTFIKITGGEIYARSVRSNAIGGNNLADGNTKLLIAPPSINPADGYALYLDAQSYESNAIRDNIRYRFTTHAWKIKSGNYADYIIPEDEDYNFYTYNDSFKPLSSGVKIVFDAGTTVSYVDANGTEKTAEAWHLFPNMEAPYTWKSDLQNGNDNKNYAELHNRVYIVDDYHLNYGVTYESSMSFEKTNVCDFIDENYRGEDGQFVSGYVPGNFGELLLPAGSDLIIADGMTVNIDSTASRNTDSEQSGKKLITRSYKDSSYASVAALAGSITYILEDYYLKIYGQKNGTGVLNARGADGKSGIDGHVAIHSGNINATGGENAPGIGLCANSDRTDCFIKIYGGTVTAVGGKNGAGIGSGLNSSANNITILGGTVTASGGTNGAGIGGGAVSPQPEEAKINARNITISGGKVDVKITGEGAGIGGGAYCSAENISITGGDVYISAMELEAVENAIDEFYDKISEIDYDTLMILYTQAEIDAYKAVFNTGKTAGVLSDADWETIRELTQPTGYKTFVLKYYSYFQASLNETELADLDSMVTNDSFVDETFSSYYSKVLNDLDSDKKDAFRADYIAAVYGREVSEVIDLYYSRFSDISESEWSELKDSANDLTYEYFDQARIEEVEKRYGDSVTVDLGHTLGNGFGALGASTGISFSDTRSFYGVKSIGRAVYDGTTPILVDDADRSELPGYLYLRVCNKVCSYYDYIESNSSLTTEPAVVVTSDTAFDDNLYNTYLVQGDITIEKDIAIGAGTGTAKTITLVFAENAKLTIKGTQSSEEPSLYLGSLCTEFRICSQSEEESELGSLVLYYSDSKDALGSYSAEEYPATLEGCSVLVRPYDESGASYTLKANRRGMVLARSLGKFTEDLTALAPLSRTLTFGSNSIQCKDYNCCFNRWLLTPDTIQPEGIETKHDWHNDDYLAFAADQSDTLLIRCATADEAGVQCTASFTITLNKPDSSHSYPYITFSSDTLFRDMKGLAPVLGISTSDNYYLLKDNYESSVLYEIFDEDQRKYVKDTGDHTSPGIYRVTIAPGVGSSATAYVEYAIEETVVQKTDPAVITGPTGKGDNAYVYDGEEHELLSSPGSVQGGTMLYAVVTHWRSGAATPTVDKFSEELPTSSEAGTNMVYWMVKGDADHNDILPLQEHRVYTDITPFAINASDYKKFNKGDLTIEDLSELLYNVRNQSVTATIKYKGKLLVPGTDYDLEIKPTIVYPGSEVTYYLYFKGNYKNTLTFSCKDLETYEYDLSEYLPKADLVYNGKAQALLSVPEETDEALLVYRVWPYDPQDEDGLTKLQELFPDEYDRYMKEQEKVYFSVPSGTNAHDYFIQITAYGRGDDGNIDYYRDCSSTVKASISSKSAEGLSVTLIDAVRYTGQALTPAVTVKDGSRVLTEGADYTLEYEDNIDIGTGRAELTFKGNYQGARTVSFTIVDTEYEVNAPAVSLTVGQKLSGSVLTGGSAAIKGTFSWKNGEIVPALSDSDSTEYTMIFTPDNGDIPACEVKVKVTVLPKMTASLYLKDGVIHIGSEEGEATLIDGLAFDSASSSWIMSGFEYTTSASPALVFADDAELTVIGRNYIASTGETAVLTKKALNITVGSHAALEFEGTVYALKGDAGSSVSVKDGSGNNASLFGRAAASAELTAVDWQNDTYCIDASPAKTILTDNFLITVISRAGENTGMALLSGGGEYLLNAQAELTAASMEGFDFDGWYLEGEKQSGEQTISVKVESDLSLEARYTPQEKAVSLKIDCDEFILTVNGEVINAKNAADGSYPVNSRVTITCPGERLLYWIDDDTEIFSEYAEQLGSTYATSFGEGKVLSSASEYSFYLTKDMSISAVCKGTEENSLTLILLGPDGTIHSQIIESEEDTVLLPDKPIVDFGKQTTLSGWTFTNSDNKTVTVSTPNVIKEFKLKKGLIIAEPKWIPGIFSPAVK